MASSLASALPLALLGLATGLASGHTTPASEEHELFETRIRPLLAESCFDCHGPDKQRSGLRVDSLAGLLAGGERGPAIVPGAPDESRLIAAVRWESEDLAMPPREKLSESDVEALAAWIQAGADAPADFHEVEGGTQKESFDLEERKKHWCFQPIADPTPPAVADETAVAGDVDRFLQARLEELEIEPSPRADRATLMRRLSFDLIGLPPTPKETRTFVESDAPDAWEREVDRLLASPHFGERWGRHWLDLVRYAETKGHEFDYLIPNAWRYRDYVIRALNEDVPYDRFVQEHIAGDLLPEPRPNVDEGWDESVLGTGFWYLGEEVHSPVDIRGDQVERVANQVDVLSKTFLGVTVACARCHDHKFDAIRTDDYYAMAGFSLSSTYRQVRYESRERNAEIENSWLRVQRHSGNKIQEATWPLLQEELKDGEKLLLLARKALLEEAAHEEAQAAASATHLRRPQWDYVLQQDRRRRLAQEAGVEFERLAAWIRLLVDARSDPLDPFHAFATIACTETSDADADDALRALRERLDPESFEGTIVLDRNSIGGSSDGPAISRFLLSRFSQATGHVERLYTPGIYKSPFWDELEITDSEGEASLIHWTQPGRTWRTQTIELPATPLYYLVEGAGHVFACIDGHRMIRGPLHDASILNIDDAPGARWVRHDLSEYAGHRAHLEFSPQTPRDGRAPHFGLLAVATAASAPTSAPYFESDYRNQILSGSAEPQALAARTIRQVSEALARQQETAAGPAGHTQTIDGLLRHQVLVEYTSRGNEELDEARSAYLRELQELSTKIHRTSRTAPAIAEVGAVDEYVLIRGSHRSPDRLAPRRHLEAVVGKGPAYNEDGFMPGSGRFQLARTLVRDDDPLVSRVAVNRVWHHLFGRGLVATVDNFGVLGEEPSHPELLDWLATRFREDSWSTKRLIRRLVLSEAYRRSSTPRPDLADVDPTNQTWARAEIKRLEGEALRDAVLMVSGTLDPTLFGPPVPIHLTDFLDGRGKPSKSGPLDGAGRRSIYQTVRRNFLQPFFAVFDTPKPTTTFGRRSNSNVPAQALALLNDPFVMQEAERWADRELTEHPDAGLRERTARMVALAFGRQASDDELDAMTSFLAATMDERGLNRDAQELWTDLAHVLFNAKEFRFLP